MNQSWLHTFRLLAIILGLAGIIWLIIAAGPLFGVITIAAILAYLLDPLVRLLTRRTQLSRDWAAGLVYLMFLLILAGIPTGLGAVVLSQFNRLEQEFFQAIAALRELFAQPIVLVGLRLNPQTLVDNLEQIGGNLVTTVSAGSFNILSGVTSNVLWGLVILVTTYYFLKDGPKIQPWLVRLFPPQYREEFEQLLTEINAVWSVFLKVQLLILLILAILMGLGTLLVIWLFRAGLLPFSPLALILLLILVYTLIQQVDNLWLRPRFLGRRLQLHPALVFIGLTWAFVVAGFLGALLVVPAMATVKILGRYFHGKLMAQSSPMQTPPSNKEMERREQNRSGEEKTIQSARTANIPEEPSRNRPG